MTITNKYKLAKCLKCGNVWLTKSKLEKPTCSKKTCRSHNTLTRPIS